MGPPRGPECSLDADGVVIGEPGGIDEDYDGCTWWAVASPGLRLVAERPAGTLKLSDELGTRNARGGRRPPSHPGSRFPGCGYPSKRPWSQRLDADGQHRDGLPRWGRLRGAARSDGRGHRGATAPEMRREDVREAFTVLVERVSQETGSDLRIELTSRPTTGCLQPLSSPATHSSRRRGRPAGRSWVPNPPVRFSQAPRRPGSARSRMPTLPALGPGLTAPRPRCRRVGVDHGGASGGRDLHPSRYYILFRDDTPAAHEEIQTMTEAASSTPTRTSSARRQSPREASTSWCPPTATPR